MTPSDDTFLRLATQGDRDAMTELLARHGPAVRQTVSNELGSRFRTIFDEDDVMQVTYLEAFLRIVELQTPNTAGFVAWLHQIARCNLRDAIKGLTRQKRPDPRRQVRPASPDDSVMTLFEMVGGDSNSPSRVAGTAERTAILVAALAQLPRDYATVLREYDLESKSIDEIATRMGRSTGAVFMLRARAIERLREILPSVSALYGASRP